MTTASDAGAADRVERERIEADRRYNEALTALDRAVVEAGARAALERADFARIATALIVFLQQITGFVDTKDRSAAAAAADRIDGLQPAIDDVNELRTQVAVLQRAVQTLQRAAAPGTPHPAPGTSTPHPAPAPGTQHPAPGTLSSGPLYVAFEDQFRGSDAAIDRKLRAYTPMFAGARGPVVDLGCGRGELLAALHASGVEVRGVDLNADMAAIARERGVDATHGDALAFLDAQDDGALGGIVATQVVEHLEPGYLIRLIDTAARKLQAGAPIVLETINPACWLAFFSSYIRDLTHVRPVHPETLQYLLRAAGFSRVAIQYSAPVPDHMKMRTVDLPATLPGLTDPAAGAIASIAHTINANAVILNNLAFTHLDYAAIGYRS
jgi:SAM-dependent methyltransferase